MKQLEADIKNRNFKRIYLLTGDQDYMIKRYEKALIDVFLPQNDGINLTRFFGKKTDIKEVLELCDTMPFMSDKRVIVLENTEFFAHAADELADHIPDIPETTVMIFCEEKIDARLKQTKAVKAHGCIAHFSTLSDQELRDFDPAFFSRA